MLSALVREYVAIKRASGYLYRVYNGLLLGFAAFAEERGEKHVRAATALAWASRAPSAAQRAGRLRLVARFARFAAQDDPAHEIPPATAFGGPAPRRPPFVFAPDDIARLLAATQDLRPCDGLRPKTYRTLLGLLAATGLRISEVLALRVDDVMPDGLLIRQTKFRKSRLVPLHATSQQALMRYLQERRGAGPEARLFVSDRGAQLPYSTVVGVFLKLVRGLGLHPGAGHRGPRIHDLRHTFAVRSLEQCAVRRDAVARHMLALSTYLGHGKIEHTYWYLQATPALMGQIAEACEALHTGGAP